MVSLNILIETYWNVKCSEVSWSLIASDINRDILECKAYKEKKRDETGTEY